METLLEQEISNHPLFPNIKRKIAVYGANIDGKFGQIVLDAEVRYFDENQNSREVTSAFSSKLNDWIVSNNDLTTVRDAQGKPMKNPDFNEEEPESEDNPQYLKMPSFDYFFCIIKNPKAPSLINLLALHITGNDEIKFFDKMLSLPIE